MCRLPVRILAVVVSLALLNVQKASAAPPLKSDPPAPMVRIQGHVLPALAKAERVVGPESSAAANAPLTLTLVLKRFDQAGFDRYLHDVYDPSSSNYRRFITQSEIVDRFGPSRDAYDGVLGYLEDNGFTLVEGSTNRLTLTVRGTRAQAEQAFAVRIADYAAGGRTFTANDRPPALPARLAPYIQAIAGLSNLASPARPSSASAPLGALIGLAPNVKTTVGVCGLLTGFTSRFGIADNLIVAIIKALLGSTVQLFALAPGVTFVCGGMLVAVGASGITCQILGLLDPTIWTRNPQCAEFAGLGFGPMGSAGAYKPKYANLLSRMLSGLGVAAAQAAPGTNAQKIGLLEFDTFKRSDVADWLAAFGGEAALGKLSDVPVNGGVATPGPNESEVLLDIDTVMLFASLPGTSYVVYHAPPSTNFQAMFNAMINDGVTVISNSWSQCEDQTTLAEAQSIDSILQQAAARGISVFNATGDTGSTCLDGSPNTIGVPADSPNATAVGGSSPSPGPGLTYGSEKWWNGIGDTPPTGQGGFGISKFFSRPSYQNGLNNISSQRSVPDVVADADPAQGLQICQASAGGCPSGRLFGGTSLAAPQWAAYAADLNTMLGTNIGMANAKLYPLAGTDAFHTAASMGSDFTHVGLGSPDLLRLRLALSGEIVGSVSLSKSLVASAASSPDGSVPADGTTAGVVQALVLDDKGSPLSGKRVALTANPGNHATITPPSGESDTDGAVVFEITDLTAEDVTFTATDTTDGIVLQQTPRITFGVPPAASAGINAFPTSVTADGVSTTTIAVTLKDALNRPTPGKLITLSQGSGQSVIKGPNPSITDSNGQIQFTAVDQVAETVTYTATDVTDGNLPLPGSGKVMFTGGTANGCGNGNPIAAPGFLVTPYATGFLAQNFFFGGVNFGGCPGAFGIAFDGSGNLYVADNPTGNIYKFPPGGGVANSSTLLTSTPIGPSLAGLAFDISGHLFAGRSATTGNFTTGAVLRIDPSTGAVLRTVASGLTCPTTIAVDPLSGDLFTDDSCSGAGSDNPSIFRISNPGGSAPTTSVYATLPGTPNATLAFAPSGTIYVWAVTASGAQVAKVSGTNGPSTPTVSILPGLTVSFLGLLAEGMQSNGDADFLILNFPSSGNVPNGIGIADLTTNPPTLSTILVSSGVSNNNLFALGPDGCLYTAQGDAVFKITDVKGACKYTAVPPAPTLALALTTISPNPAQGTSQSFTASLHYVPAPAGTPIFLQVIGANPQIKVGRADANGQASFTYTAVKPGNDTIVASATINTSTVTSNPAQITWIAGQHVTFLSLNLSPTAGSPGQPINVMASLTDSSLDPPAPVFGATIDFTLGSAQCFGATDADGIATCQLVTSRVGMDTLTATFAGTSQLVESSAAVGFNLVALPSRALRGDLNCDGDVDQDDLNILLRNLNKPVSQSACGHTVCGTSCDLDGNGKITALDSRKLVLLCTRPRCATH